MTHRTLESKQAVILEPTQPARASIIWLHGLGADGYDFVPIVPALDVPTLDTVRFVFPHAPIRPVTLNAGMPMRAWFDVTGFDRNALQDEAGIRASDAAIREWIERERERGIEARSVVLAGFSQGGAMALFTGLRYPERLAGVLALSTYLPLGPALADEGSAANRDVPILMCHGRFDPVVSIEYGERSHEHLTKLGYTVDWREYPMQHEVSPEEIAAIAQWLSARLD
jgi:phospholipase/carboxylesterase